MTLNSTEGKFELIWKKIGENGLEVNPGDPPVGLVVVLRLKRWLSHLQESQYREQSPGTNLDN